LEKLSGDQTAFRATIDAHWEAYVKFNRFFLAVRVLGILGSVAVVAQGPPAPAGDPATPIFWTASQMREIDARLSARQDPIMHNAGARLIGSANVIYRTGPSQSEIHQKQGDFIFVREGEGTILVGGKMVGGKPERANEIRGDSIEGGARYEVAAGDTLYIPVNTPHQFFVDPGKHFEITIVKINPLP
jgi:mannose-6-phosphate isomerase-like protein (cupin superfamily)